MINLQERRDQQYGPYPPYPQGATETGSAPTEVRQHTPWLDEAEHSVEPAAGTYLIRRIVVVGAMLALMAVGAFGSSS